MIRMMYDDIDDVDKFDVDEIELIMNDGNNSNFYVDVIYV